MGVEFYTFSSNLTPERRLVILGIYNQNNPFLGIFQLKVYLKTFQTCS